MFVFSTADEAYIGGNPAELRAVGERIAQLRRDEWAHFFCEWRRDSRPYERCLVALEVTATEGPVRAEVRGDRLCVAGGPEHLGVFGSYFQFSDDDHPGHHRHFEWWGGYEHAHPESLPLVIGLP